MANTEELLKTLNAAADCKSLMKKNLTPEIQGKYKATKTKLGGSLGDCIKSGVENLDSGVGLYACDPEAYTTFRELFDGVIRDYHKVPAGQAITHPKPDFGDLNNLDFGNLDPDGKHVVSTRIRVARSVEGYSFPPCLKNEQRMELEGKQRKALEGFTGELKGVYHPLTGMSKETQTKLVEDHFLFNDHDRFLKSAGGYNDWPNGRGIFFNDNKTFLVWCNEEDHLRLISMQMGGDLAQVYKRLCTAANEIEKSGMPFAKADHLGYLTFCPSNLGTTMRASVHMKIPNTAALPHFKEICEHLQIQARGIHGEHTESVGGVYDLSNKRRLGLSEIQAVKEMAKGVSILLLLEKSLEGKK